MVIDTGYPGHSTICNQVLLRNDMKKSLNIAIADDHPIFIEGLRTVLSNPLHSNYSYNIIGVARTGPQVAQILKETSVDVLLLDLNLPETDGLQVLPLVRKEHPGVRVFVLTVYEEPKLVKAAFKSGTDGYMLKTGGREELFKGIDEIMSGNTFLGRGVEVTDRNLRGGGVGLSVYEDKFAKRHSLTKREMEVLRFIGQALNNKDISEKLYISDQTVSVHRKNIMRKLGVNTTANLIKIAYENNLV